MEARDDAAQNGPVDNDHAPNIQDTQVDASTPDSVTSSNVDPNAAQDVTEPLDGWTDHVKSRWGQLNKKFKKEKGTLQRELEEARTINAQLASQMQGANQEYGAPQESAEQGDPNSVQHQVQQELQRQGQLREQQIAQTRAQEQKHYMDARTEQFLDKIEEAKTKYPDFSAVVEREELPFTDAMVEVAKLAPNGEDLVYFLAKNPKEVERISRLNPYVQAQEVLKHMLNLNSSPNVSNAPAPVQPLGKNDSKPVASIVDMNYSQIKAKDKQKHHTRRQRR